MTKPQTPLASLTVSLKFGWLSDIEEFRTKLEIASTPSLLDSWTPKIPNGLVIVLGVRAFSPQQKQAC